MRYTCLSSRPRQAQKDVEHNTEWKAARDAELANINTILASLTEPRDPENEVRAAEADSAVVIAAEERAKAVQELAKLLPRDGRSNSVKFTAPMPDWCPETSDEDIVMPGAPIDAVIEKVFYRHLTRLPYCVWKTRDGMIVTSFPVKWSELSAAGYAKATKARDDYNKGLAISSRRHQRRRWR